MKKQIIITLLCCFSICMFYCMSVRCMPSLEFVKQYEKNIEDYCNNEEEFIIASEDGLFLVEPKGNSEETVFYGFYYYIDSNNQIKQVYKGKKYVCITVWQNGEFVDCSRYILK